MIRIQVPPLIRLPILELTPPIKIPSSRKLHKDKEPIESTELDDRLKYEPSKDHFPSLV